MLKQTAPQPGYGVTAESQPILNQPGESPPSQGPEFQLNSAGASPYSPQLDQESALSHREASLMRSFIQKIAPWVSNSITQWIQKMCDLIPQKADICDPQSSFSTVVPQRALQVPMVFKALLALAARHDAILTGNSDWEASSYHGQCLELLIPALDQPEHTYNENLLITVVILRICEELENNTDEKFHLLGSNRLINLMSRSASSGGLAEAVSWQFLRQAIYSSIVQYQPLQLNLRNYECSTMFQREDDAAVANMIIFHCAQIIQHYREGPGALVDPDSWQSSAKSIEAWHQSKPITWQPLRYQAPDAASDRPFPEIWMMSPPAGLYLLSLDMPVSWMCWYMSKLLVCNTIMPHVFFSRCQILILSQSVTLRWLVVGAWQKYELNHNLKKATRLIIK